MKRLFRGFFVMLIIVGAGFLAEALYFGLLLSKSDSHQAADTIFILNGASERIKQGYELAAEKEESGNRREETGKRIGSQTIP